jgi:hypothetical protein
LIWALAGVRQYNGGIIITIREFWFQAWSGNTRSLFIGVKGFEKGQKDKPIHRLRAADPNAEDTKRSASRQGDEEIGKK